MDLPLNEAEIVLVPVPTAAAMPLASTVATAVSLDIQATEPEILPLLPSEKPPVAVNVAIAPLARETVAGAIVMPVNEALVTVTTSLADVALYNIPLFTEADIVDAPTALPVTTPVLPTLAIPGTEELHVTKLEMSAVLPSE